MTQPHHEYPEWPFTGPPCSFVTEQPPTDWSRLLHIQATAAALRTLSGRLRETEPHPYAAGRQALLVKTNELADTAQPYTAAIGGGAPPAQPDAEAVATAKRMLSEARGALPAPDADAGTQTPDPWHAAVCRMIGAAALLTAVCEHHDEYRAAGPPAAAAWREVANRMAHQCRHADADLREHATQTAAGVGRRARRRLLAQANGASRTARQAYHEAVAGPRRHMPVRYRPQATDAGLPRLLDPEEVRRVAASDAECVVVVCLTAEAEPEIVTVLIIEHEPELHVLLPDDTAPAGLPATALLESHIAQQALAVVTDPDADPDDYPAETAVTGLMAAAGAGLHDAEPVDLRQLGQAISDAVQADPHAIAILEDAMAEPFGEFLTAWLLMQCQLPPSIADPPTDADEMPPFFTPEQNRALLTAGAAAGISPYGLKRLAIVIGADTEPGYTDPLPKHTAATAAAVHDALRHAIPEVNIRYDLAQILEQELGIAEPAA